MFGLMKLDLTKVMPWVRYGPMLQATEFPISLQYLMVPAGTDEGGKTEREVIPHYDNTQTYRPNPGQPPTKIQTELMVQTREKMRGYYGASPSLRAYLTIEQRGQQWAITATGGRLYGPNGIWVPQLAFAPGVSVKLVLIGENPTIPTWEMSKPMVGLYIEESVCPWPKAILWFWQQMAIARHHQEWFRIPRTAH